MTQPHQPAEPPRITQTKSGQTITLILSMIVLALVVSVGSWVYWFFFTTNPLLGVWKATDPYGGQHFYEFREGRHVTWWDIDRESLDSEPQKRGPFEGIYYYEKDAIVAKGHGLLAPRVGVLRWQNKNQLKQDHDGHIIRQNLTYTRVMPE